MSLMFTEESTSMIKQTNRGVREKEKTDNAM